MYEEMKNTYAQCDLCGRKAPQRTIFKGANHICLCKVCLQKLKTLPEKTQEKLEKYLIGNVV